jgi:hypothetical protein
LICPKCSAVIDYPKCETCPDEHLIFFEVFKCSKCGKEGCEENIGICGFVSGGFSCDKFICFDCGYGCVEECDMVRCCFEHAEKCRECGCGDSVMCGQCQRQMYNDKESKCVDCLDDINEVYLEKLRKCEDKFDYERFEKIEEYFSHGTIPERDSRFDQDMFKYYTCDV